MSSPYNTQQYAVLKKFWSEPDFLNSCAYGLPIALRRNLQKAWCGYVGIPSSHPHFNLSYSEEILYGDWELRQVGGKSPMTLLITAMKIDSIKETSKISLDAIYDAPGGLTYSGADWPTEVPKGYWWFGFDCSHYDDITPREVFQSFSGYPYSLKPEGEYRTLEYVLTACRKLASRLSDFSSSFPEESVG